MILAVEEIAREDLDLVGTVGAVEARPGAVNVVPGAVRFSIDLRSPLDKIRKTGERKIKARLKDIARHRKVRLTMTRTHEAAATPCDPDLMSVLELALKKEGLQSRQLVSGAGHDAMAVAALCPVAIMFVRCKGGISHNPAESITVEDADAAVRVLLAAIRELGQTYAV